MNFSEKFMYKRHTCTQIQWLWYCSILASDGSIYIGISWLRLYIPLLFYSQEWCIGKTLLRYTYKEFLVIALLNRKRKFKREQSHAETAWGKKLHVDVRLSVGKSGFFFSLPYSIPLFPPNPPYIFLQTTSTLFSRLYISIFLEKFCIIMYKTQTHIYKFNGYNIAALASVCSIIYIILKMNGCFKPIWLPWFHASLLFIIKRLIKTFPSSAFTNVLVIGH